jgi:hypothetical protein
LQEDDFSGTKITGFFPRPPIFRKRRRYRAHRPRRRISGKVWQERGTEANVMLPSHGRGILMMGDVVQARQVWFFCCWRGSLCLLGAGLFQRIGTGFPPRGVKMCL